MPDSNAELLDVLTADGAPTGETKPRGLIHRDGDWHRAFHLWIVREGKLVLLQRRARTKDLGGGRLDVSVGGHFGTGETLPDVLRETEEEIGLSVRSGELHYLGTFPTERRYPDAIDREHQEVYALRRDDDLRSYHLACREVEVLYEVPIERAVGLYRAGAYVAAAGWDCQQRNNNALLVEDDLIEEAREDTLAALERLRDWLEEGERASG